MSVEAPTTDLREAALERILPRLRCPTTGAPLARAGDELRSDAGTRWPIVRGIPRFVSTDHYVGSFSFEWNTHPETQLDSITGGRSSEEMLVQKTGLSPEQVAGKLVLDAGIGAGRFADVLSRWGAHVVGIDLSYAVEASGRTLGPRGVVVAQADITRPPFAPGTFDHVVSIGVLHHTPDTRASFEALVPLLRPGGEICIWLYPPTEYYELRRQWTPFVRRLPPRAFHAFCRRWVPFVRARRANPLLRYLEQYFECSDQGLGLDNDILDTFDAYSPYYHWTHGTDEVRAWFAAAGLVDVRTLPWDTAVRGRRPG